MNLRSEHVNSSHPVLRRLPMFGAAVALIALAACERNNDVVLPGKRIGLLDVLGQSEATATPEAEGTRALSLATASNNSEWAQFWGNPDARVTHPALASSLSLAWSNPIGSGEGRKQRISADPVVGGGLIYTLDAGATLTATNASGQTAWRRDLTSGRNDRDAVSGGGVSYADGRVYVSTNVGRLFVVDATDGSEIWSQELEATSSAAPTVSGDLVYLISGDNTGWALEKASGRVRWQIGAVEDVNIVFGAPSPVVTSDLAIFAFGAGDVQAVFRRGGLRRWDSAVVGERVGYALSKVGDITAGPVVVGDTIFVGNQSGRAVALDVGSGKRIWTAFDGAAGPIWPAGDSVFFVSDRNELLRLDAQTGAKIWGTRLPNFTTERLRRQVEVFAHFGPILAGGRLVLASSDGQLRSFDPESGAELGAVEIPGGGAATGPAIAGNTLYVVNARGALLAYR